MKHRMSREILMVIASIALIANFGMGEAQGFCYEPEMEKR